MNHNFLYKNQCNTVKCKKKLIKVIKILNLLLKSNKKFGNGNQTG